MNLNEFKQKYSNLIIEYLEEYPGRKPTRRNSFSKGFTDWLLQQRNIKITFKYAKIKPYNDISEFFLNFLYEHAYLKKKKLIEDYMLKFKSPENEFNSIRNEFNILTYRHLKCGALEKHSKTTYKINKEIIGNGKLNGKS